MGVYEGERAALRPYAGPFDGFNASEVTAPATCLVNFDRNQYSVMPPNPCGAPHGTSGHAARKAVQIRAYADRIVFRFDGKAVAEHARSFGRDQIVYDHWRYLPVLASKPGAP